ncbi:branched-chain amino acid transport protein AzlD [Betaproteobacteria bacterium]|nr:branched-chain amino acid transport protein AzlD [Betaproteobacteria bacterium]
MSAFETAIMIAVAALATMATRFAAFWFFGARAVPPFVTYLGRVLPPAVMAMLIVFCLKDTPMTRAPHGLPECLGVAITVGLYRWRRNVLLAVLGGTVAYMGLLRGVTALV